MADEQLTIYQAAIKNFLGPILPLLEDESVTEVLVNGPNEIFVES